MRLSDFAFRLDDIKNTDINDPASWPVSMTMLVIIIGAGLILFGGQPAPTGAIDSTSNP